MKQTGVTSASELGILALAGLAQYDPVSAFMLRNKGRLGRDHKLDYLSEEDPSFAKAR